MDDTTRSVEQQSDAIRSEIEQTREEMAETIEAIQDKLRPSTIVANATERVKTATTERVRAMADTAGDAAQNVMNRTREGAGGFVDLIRDNPYPTALIGVGAAWLIMNGRSSGRRSSSYSWSRDGERSYGSDYGRSYGDFQSSYGGSQSSSYGGSQSAYGGSQSSYGGGSTEAGGTMDELKSQARQYAGQTTDTIRRTSRRAQNQLQRMLQDNPLLVGAGALMLGAAFGLAVPETERENELMGEMRDSVVERAQQMAGDAASKVQETAKQVADTAGNVAQSVSSEPRRS